MTRTTPHPATVLVIEDDDASRWLFTYLLEAAGHRVLAAENGAAGLALALAEGPDIVLCDLQMPVMNGYEVARGLRASPHWRVVPLVAVTAFSMPGDREKALEVGFNEHLPKPITPETFVQQIEAFLASARQAPSPPGGTPRT
jgi:CheY-like chemotaxis protein